MRKIFIFISLSFLFLADLPSAIAQEVLGHMAVEGSDGKLNLRIVSVADAVAAGNGVVKVRLDGITGAADLVLTNHAQASPVRIRTPYGTRSWRLENQFALAFGGTGSDLFTSLVQTTDGGFALGGYTNSYGAGLYDQWLSKTDSEGNISWSAVYGGAETEYGQAVIQRNDGGYLLLGSYSASGTTYMYLNFTDASGNSTQSGYFIPATGNTSGYGVIQCTDGNFVGVGSCNGFGPASTNIYLKKFDGSGNNIWGYAIGTDNYEIGYDVVQRPDEGFAVVGVINTSDGGEDTYFGMIDPLGTVEIAYSVGGPDGDVGRAICKSADGGFAYIGRTWSFGAGQWDFYMVKRTSAGTLDWSRTFGGTDSELGEDITCTSDGGFALTGKASSFGAGGIDGWLIKTDALGNPEWSWVFGGTGNDAGYSVQQGADGCYYVAGITSSFGAGGNDAFLVKFTPDGASCLGYAIGFGARMQPLDQNDSRFKVSKTGDFSETIIQSNEKRLPALTAPANEKLKAGAISSRTFITPSALTICD